MSIMNAFVQRIYVKLKQIVTHPQFSAGTACLTFFFLGSYGLREFTQIRYDVKKMRGYSTEMEEELRKSGAKIKPQKSLETLYDEMIENKDLDDWYNIRGPRPDENSKQIQDEQRNEIEKLLKKKTVE